MTPILKPPPGIPSTWPDKKTGKHLPFRAAYPLEDSIRARFDDGNGNKAVIPFILNGDGKYKAGGPPKPYALGGKESLRDPGQPALVQEGQPKTAAAIFLGFQSVTSGGAQTAHDADWTPLQAFRRIFVLPDNDEPGEAYARAVVGILSALPGAREIKIVRLPGLPEGGDLVDWLKARMPEWNGFTPPPVDAGDGIVDELWDTINEVAAPPPAEWAGAADAGPETWEPPVSLDAAIVPPWPRDVFPPDVQAFVNALADSTETPPELPAMMTLAVVAATAQGKYRLRIKHDYFEPLSLWTCSALQSGGRKTAVKQAVTEPLVQWEHDRRTELEPERARKESEAKTIQGRVDALRSKAASPKTKPVEVHALLQEIEGLEHERPEVPRLPQVWADDVTPETLAVIMEENRECMALLSDEDGMLDILAGRYSNGIPNLDVYLQGHAGSPVRVNRGSRPAVFLKSPCLSVGICPQPDVVRGMQDKPGFRARGLIARFLYAMPVSNLGRRTGNTPPMPDHVREAYTETVRAMLDQPWAVDAAGNECAHILRLSPEAFDLWAEFARQTEAQLGEGGTFDHISDWGGKLPGAVGRVAAVLHVARHAHGDPAQHSIEAADMAAAIRLGECLSKHALLAFAEMGADVALDDARRILAWIQRERLSGFSKRDCHAAHRSRFPRAEALAAPLEILTERGHIRQKPGPIASGPGRPPKMFEVNPLVHEGRADA